MAEPGKGDRDVVERLTLAAVGVVSLTADRIEELAGELSERGGMRRDEARQLLEDAVTRWRGDADQVRRAGGGEPRRRSRASSASSPATRSRSSSSASRSSSTGCACSSVRGKSSRRPLRRGLSPRGARVNEIRPAEVQH